VEEVLVVREEIKRVLRMLRSIQAIWEGHAEQRQDIDTELTAGLNAYVVRQVFLHR
jgi:hypothetical protein